MRQSYVYCRVEQRLIPKDEYYAGQPTGGVMVIPDIAGYRSQATGEWIGSRSSHREHLKANQLIEIGNEKVPPKRLEVDRKGTRQAAVDAYHRVMGY